MPRKSTILPKSMPVLKKILQIILPLGLAVLFVLAGLQGNGL
jgi:hypothetical protein